MASDTASSQRIPASAPEPSLKLATGARHTLTVEWATLHVQLPIDPNDASSYDDRFILTAARGGDTRVQIKTIRDDQVPGDQSVDLVYEGLYDGWVFTLEVDPGDGAEPYRLFEKVPFAELFG